MKYKVRVTNRDYQGEETIGGIVVLKPVERAAKRKKLNAFQRGNEVAFSSPSLSTSCKVTLSHAQMKALKNKEPFTLEVILPVEQGKYG